MTAAKLTTALNQLRGIYFPPLLSTESIKVENFNTGSLKQWIPPYALTSGKKWIPAMPLLMDNLFA